jgi:PAS domain S-box-containing protein
VRSLFLPPQFDDESKNTSARILYGIIWPAMFCVTVILLAIGSLLPDQLIRWLTIIGLVDFLGLLIVLLVRRGHTRLAGFTLLFGLWAIVFVFSLTSGGVKAPASISLIILILTAGLIFGIRGGVVFAVISILTWLLLTIIEITGFLPPSTDLHTPLTLWAVFSIYGLIAIVLQALSNRVIHESLVRAHEGESLYRANFQSGSDAMFVYGLAPDGQPEPFLKANDAACQWLGFSPSEFLGLTIHDIDAPGSELRRSAALRNLRREEKASFEIEFIAKDGRRVPAEVNARLMNLDGKPVVLCIARDITRHKQTEEALRESEMRYREVYDNSSEGIFLLDVTSDGRFRLAGCNPAQMRMLGLTVTPREEFIENVLPEGLTGQIAPNYRRCVLSGLPMHYEEELAFPDGNRTFDTQLIPVRGEKGRVQRLIGISRDITQTKKSAQALDTANRYAQNLIATANAMVVHLDRNGKVLIFNQAAEDITGYSLEEIRGQNWFEKIVPRERYPAAWQEFERLMAGGIPIHFENPILSKNGEERYIAWQNSLLHEGGALTGILSFGLDITERKQRETELQTISSLSTALRTAATRAEMLPIIVQQVVNLMDLENVSLELVDSGSGDSIVEQAHGRWAQAIGLHIPAVANPPDAQPFVDNDAIDHPQRVRPAPLDGCRAVAGIPMIAQDNTIGALWIGRQQTIREEEVRLLTAVADIAANAIRRTTLFEQIQRDIQRLAALHEIDSAISGTMDINVALAVVVSHVIHQLNADAADVVIFNPSSRILQPGAGQGFHNPSMGQNRLRSTGNLAERVIRERNAIHIGDLTDLGDTLEARWLVQSEGFRGYHAVPLLAKGQVLGALEVFQRASFEPDREWLGFFATIAEQAAIAIENAHLFSDLQRANSELYLAYDETIEGWSHALDLRDRETEGHTLRVTELTMKLAVDMRLPESELMHIRRGALLHDIGKMGVPDSILLKPGKLTAEEWTVMRQHPEYAHQLLASIRYLHPALDIPYCHHEKWDGTGYPRGLKGEQIPLAARAFALVDVWDALTSDRPYRKAWSGERARQYIRESAGTHFDPAAADKFLALIQREDAIPWVQNRPPDAEAHE